MFVTAADRKAHRQAHQICCLSIIVAAIVFGISMIFIKDIGIVFGIAIATFIGTCCLLALLLSKEEIKKAREDRRKKRNAELSKFYSAGAPGAPVSSFRQTELRGAPSKIVCHVCGATYENFVNYCEKCGAKMIRST